MMNQNKVLFWSAMAAFFVPFGMALAEEEAKSEPAFLLETVYTGEIWSLARGGLNKGVSYLHNVDLMLTADMEKAVGWDGGMLFLYGLHTNQSSFSDKRVGDFQVVSNIDSGSVFRLFEAWYEQSLADGALSLKAGLYDLNTEFDVTETGGLFINSSHGIGPDFSQAGENGPSIFPSTSLAFRLQYQPAENWLIRAAVLDGVPNNSDRPKRQAIRFGAGEGILLVGEIEYRPDDRTRMLAGHWLFTDDFEVIETGLMADGDSGSYGLIERQLYREAADSAQGLSAWIRAGAADGRFNDASGFVGAGLAYTGLFARRDHDQLGAAVAIALPGDGFSNILAEKSAREVNIELTWRAEIIPGIVVQPDLQLIRNPGMIESRRDAIALGLRLEIGWGGGF
ncbi:carbohydrate porin [Iodidimonas nitroreducens]|nr:carbohydrate porin [Iodidimonas nitroreducens]